MAVRFLTIDNPYALNYEEVSSEYETISAKYIELIIERADEFVEKEEHGKAISVINTALKNLTDDSKTELLEKKEQIESSIPVLLSDVKMTTSNYIEQITVDKGSVEDNIGNILAPGNLFKMNIWNSLVGYAEVYVNQQYSTLKGTISVSDETKEGVSLFFEVYADDKLIHTEKLDKKTTPISVDIDISNAEWIKLQLKKTESADYFGHGEVYLSDFKFYS